MTRVTLKSVAALIARERGMSVELVRGNGYFYFVGDGLSRWPSTSVATCQLTALTLEMWLAEFDQLAHEARFVIANIPNVDELDHDDDNRPIML